MAENEGEKNKKEKEIFIQDLLMKHEFNTLSDEELLKNWLKEFMKRLMKSYVHRTRFIPTENDLANLEQIERRIPNRGERTGNKNE